MGNGLKLSNYSSIKEIAWNKKEQCLRDMWDTSNHSNILIIEIPKGAVREKGAKSIFEK